MAPRSHLEFNRSIVEALAAQNLQSLPPVLAEAILVSDHKKTPRGWISEKIPGKKEKQRACIVCNDSSKSRHTTTMDCYTCSSTPYMYPEKNTLLSYKVQYVYIT